MGMPKTHIKFRYKNYIVMNENELSKLKLVGLTKSDLVKTNGGVLWALLGMYLIWETAADPVGSWNAFKKGWHSI
jgi:hypothetical protein